jgi:murein DD-endopeptidase MepM/ murein hydrolase activator NlpD
LLSLAFTISSAFVVADSSFGKISQITGKPMPKVKYYFNTHSLKYEKVVVSVWKRTLRVMAFLAVAVVFGSVTMLISYSYFDSPQEKQLKRELDEMGLQYELLNNRLIQISAVLGDLQERDDNIYRVIFEAEAIPSEIRQAGFGGVNKYRALEKNSNAELMIETTKKVDQITKQIYIQSKSFDEIFKLSRNKAEMLASIPAIQPVSNKKLKKLASGFGNRIHPIYKTVKMHSGVDFTTPVGAEIYATGNGRVSGIEKGGRGYGNNVIINHGYGYETLYAHMSKIAVTNGQKVKRGDIIGYVGSSGTSTGPHLHYEVIKNGKKINPINFFFNDLTAAEYEQMLEISSQVNQSFD